MAPVLPATAKLGISLRGLRCLRGAVEEEFGAEAGTITTNDVNEKWVKPRTAARRCRLAEMSDWVAPEDVGVPLYFISHAWKNRFSLLLDYVFHFLSAASDDIRVWIDIFAVNQNSDSPQQKEDVAAFSDVVQACTGGTIVVMDVANCNPASRAWCIFEWAHTLGAHGPDGLHLELLPDDRQATFCDLDVSKAECYFQKDKEMIMDVVKKQHGSAEAFNAKLRLQLLLEPLSYSVDVNRLLQGSKGAVWRWEPIQRWLAEEPGQGARALCIASGAAEGKSTISAALLTGPLGGGAGGFGGGTGGFVGGAGGAAAPGAPTPAAHFLKYDDQRRLEPVRIIKSLAFQLALRLPAVRHALLDLDAARVSTISDVEKACELLLLAPLRLHQAQGGGQVVILLDALDEADPPEEQRQPAMVEKPEAGTDRSRAGEESAAQLQPVRVPQVCGNAALSLLTSQLIRLPGCVRFILTTQPEAAARQVLPCLRRTFTAATAGELAADADAEAAASEELLLHRSSEIRKNVRSGVLNLSPGELREPAAAHAAGGTAPAPCSGTPPLSGVMLCYTVAQLCHQMARQAGDAVAEDAAAPFLLPQSNFASGSGPGVTDGSVWRSSEGSKAGSSGDGAAARGPGRPPTLADLYDLYGHILRISYSQYTALQERDVSLLLSVLFAAQEPLSQAHLAQLGLGGTAPLLPGWGVLFFTAEHHVYTLHKSLADFILSSSSGISRRAVNMRKGHLALGLQLAINLDSPSAYALKYLPHHLTAAAVPAPAAPMAQWTAVVPRDWCSTQALEVLDTALSHLGFFASLLASRHGPRLVRALASLPPHCHSALSLDVLRWLRSGRQDLLSGGGSEADEMDGVQGGAVTASRLLSTLLSTTPLPSELYRQATALQRHGWRTRTLMPWQPPFSSWPSTSLELRGHFMDVTSVEWSPDGHQIVSGSCYEPLCVWDAATGHCLAKLPVPGEDSDPDLKVYDVVWHPHGHTIACGRYDGAVRLWDVATGQCTAVMHGRHASRVLCLRWRPDGGALASGGHDGTVRLSGAGVGVGSGGLLLQVGASVRHVAWSPDGARIAAASEGNGVCVFEAGSGQMVSKLLEGTDVVVVEWRPDGRALASYSAGQPRVCVWDVAAASCTATLELPDAGAALCGLSWSRDGARLSFVVLAGGECSVRVWWIASGRRTSQLHLAHGVAGVAKMAWGSMGLPRLAGCVESDIRVWELDPEPDSAGAEAEAAPEAETLDSEGPGQQAVALGPTIRTSVQSSLSWSPDGSYIVSGGVSIPMWDAGNGRCVRTLAADDGFELECVAWSPDGSRIAGCQKPVWRVEDAIPYILQVAAAQRALQADGGPSMCEESPGRTDDDGAERSEGQEPLQTREDASADVLLWDAATGQLAKRLRGHTHRVVGVSWSDDGAKVVSGSRDGQARMWDVVKGVCLTVLDLRLGPGNAELWCLSCSPDGARVAAGGGSEEKGDVRVLAAAQAGCQPVLLEGHPDIVFGVAWSPDGRRLASAGRESSVRVWDVVTGACLVQLWGHSGSVRNVAWAPDGRRLASSGQDDGSVGVWNVEAGTWTAVLRGHRGAVTCVGWRRDGQQLASCGADGTVRVWEDTDVAA